MTPLGVDFPALDFAQLARAFSAYGVRGRDALAVADAVGVAMSADRPTVIVVEEEAL